MKHEWRKHEKGLYLPTSSPELITVPGFNFLTIEGEGNPNSAHFEYCVQALYTCSYAVKMRSKKETGSSGYRDYTVYPLEGIWSIARPEEFDVNAAIDKSNLKYTIMIRQADFLSAEFIESILDDVRRKKKTTMTESVQFTSIEDGLCIQMLHTGSYDNEPESFRKMSDFAGKQSLRRRSLDHREIYLNDARKTPAQKLKTVLRMFIEEQKQQD
ncbi:GyrI-like domain-containing protein [Spirochaeta dissipatitropha]